MSEGFKSILFAVVLCLVCSVLLTTANTGLKSYQLQNIAVDRQKNILMAVGLIEEGRSYEPAAIHALYDGSIQNLWVDAGGVVVPESRRSEKDLPIYLYTRDGTVEAYVVPIDSRGLWGKIYGYLAIDKDGSTIRGFTVYKHSETPGLGGEIEQRWFQKNFENKKIVNRMGSFVSIGIAKGKVGEIVPEPLQANYVDGISGATLTGKFLSAGLQHTLGAYEPISIRFRKHQRVTENEN
jgi:Na+-transporting NADH:ubiquinone oxidoreductase subunit C